VTALTRAQPDQDAVAPALRGSRLRPALERAIQLVLLGCASTAVVVVLFIFLYLGREGLPLLGTEQAGTLLSGRWQPESSHPGYGLGPLVSGSIVVTLLGTLLAVPFGVGGAVYVAAFAGPRERELLKPFIEVLAGIPSVVLGFFGLVVIGPAVKGVFGLPSGLTALTGATLLAFMAVPTILTIAEDALRAVPASYRDAALALGATPWQTTWRVVVPAARSGLLAAIMLGLGRVIGETMAVMMCTGNAAQVSWSPFESVRTMTATVAAEMGEVPFGSDHYQALFLVGLVLLAMTLAINLTAQRVLGGRGVHP
jgi:phosphate transport system permease protein